MQWIHVGYGAFVSVFGAPFARLKRPTMLLTVCTYVIDGIFGMSLKSSHDLPQERGLQTSLLYCKWSKAVSSEIEL